MIEKAEWIVRDGGKKYLSVKFNWNKEEIFIGSDELEELASFSHLQKRLVEADVNLIDCNSRWYAADGETRGALARLEKIEKAARDTIDAVSTGRWNAVTYAVDRLRDALARTV